jgi:hypothetical protein
MSSDPSARTFSSVTALERERRRLLADAVPLLGWAPSPDPGGYPLVVVDTSKRADVRRLVADVRRGQDTRTSIALADVLRHGQEQHLLLITFEWPRRVRLVLPVNLEADLEVWRNVAAAGGLDLELGPLGLMASFACPDVAAELAELLTRKADH